MQLDSIQFLLEHNGSVFQRYGRNVRKYSTLSNSNNLDNANYQVKGEGCKEYVKLINSNVFSVYVYPLTVSSVILLHRSDQYLRSHI